MKKRFYNVPTAEILKVGLLDDFIMASNDEIVADLPITDEGDF